MSTQLTNPFSWLESSSSPGSSGCSMRSASSSSTKTPLDVPRRVSDALQEKGIEVDPYGTVSWNERSAGHPRRWSLLRKSYDSAIICFLEFFVTLISNTGASIAPAIMPEFGVSREVAILVLTTTYLLGQGAGGLVFPPIAESFGGRAIYVTSTGIYAISCLIMAAVPSLPVLIVGRIITGIASAMPGVVAASSIENMWDVKARVWLIHTWVSAAVLGIAVGPAFATYIETSSLGWKWIFYVAAAVTGVLTLLCMFMQESRPSKVLRHHIKVVARRTSFDGLSFDGDDIVPSLRIFIRLHMAMPIRLFFTEPIVFLTSIMAATVYGLSYLFTAVLSIVYGSGYGFSDRHSSLVFLALAIGVGFTFLTRVYDQHKLKRCAGQVIQPEDKLFGFYVAAPVLAIGLWWFALTVPPLVDAGSVSPFVSIAALVLIGFSIVEFDNVLSGYLTDTYTKYAASANSSLAFLRTVLSGTFPLFGTQMFESLGSNNALFILAGIATLFCGIAALFGVYGKRIRENSLFAEKASSTAADFAASSNAAIVVPSGHGVERIGSRAETIV